MGINSRLSLTRSKKTVALYTRVTKSVLGIVLGLWLVSMIHDYSIRLATSHSDTALFLEMTSQWSGRGVGESQMVNAISAVYNYLGPLPVVEICQKLATPIEVIRVDVFSIHPYLISEPLSLVGQLTHLPTHIWGAFLMVSSVLIGLVYIVRFMREVDIHMVLVLGMLPVVMTFPVLTLSLLGQAYFDRLLFGPAVVLMLGLYRLHRSIEVNTWSQVASVVALTVISERGALLAALLGCVYNLLLNGRGVFRRGTSRKVFAFGLVSLVYSLIYLLFFANFATGGTSPTDIQTRIQSIIDSPFNLVTFLWMSSPLLLLATCSGRTFAVVLTSLVPNVLVTIGGAELTGFTTHYHQFYLPVLSCGAVIGMSRILSSVTAKGSQLRIFCIQFVVVASTCLGSYAVWNLLAVNRGVAAPLASAQRVWIPFSPLATAERSVRQSFLADARKLLEPTGTSPNLSVSLPEGFFSAAYVSSELKFFYWPMGVGASDFVIAPISSGKPVMFPHGDVFGKEAELASCVVAILRDRYVLVGENLDGGLRLYKRAS